MKTTMKFAAAFGLVLLSACTMSPPESAVPDLTFAQVQPVRVNAARIEVVDNYVSPEAAPNVEHTFKTTPETAARHLIDRQLVAAGGDKVLRVHIEDASVVKKNLPLKKEPLGGIVNRRPAETYNGSMRLRFELVSDAAPDVVLAHADITASRSKTLLEGATLAEHDRAMFELTEAMMNDLAQGIGSTVQATFGAPF